MRFIDPDGRHGIETQILSTFNYRGIPTANVDPSTGVISLGANSGNISRPIGARGKSNNIGSNNQPIARFLINEGTKENPQLALIEAIASMEGADDKSSPPRILKFNKYKVNVLRDKDGNPIGLEKGDQVGGTQNLVIFRKEKNPQKLNGRKTHVGVKVFDPNVVTDVDPAHDIGKNNQQGHDISEAVNQSINQ